VIQKVNLDSKVQRRKVGILRSAAAAFRERGFEAASLREIARAVDLTPGALYHYFENKADLLYFCQEVSADRLLEKGRAVLRGRGSWEERLRTLLREHVLCMLDELHGAAAHIEFHALPEPRLRTIVRKRDAYEAIVRKVLEGGVRAREFRACDPKLVGLAILGAVNWTARWYRPDGPRTPAEIAETFSDYLVRGVLR
jgi:AcrR family transcriptional regulator